MAGRPAAAKKQSGAVATIRQVLEAQEAGLWYAPKAQTHSSHIWLRKAFGGVFSPFVFKKPAVADQRCNYIIPKKGIDWRELAAVATSSVFALALESEGGAAMGGGALEVATTQLRQLPVLDLRALGRGDRKQVVKLAQRVWAHEHPVDWLNEPRPGKGLNELDLLLLDRLPGNVRLERLYADLEATCRARRTLADDKKTKKKAIRAENVTHVAKGITESFRERIDGLGFPEGCEPPGVPTSSYRFPTNGSLHVECHEFMDTADVVVSTLQGQVLLDTKVPCAVGQVIVRSLLLGRRVFRAPTDEAGAEHALTAYKRRLQPVLEEMARACLESALGTKHEHGVFVETVRLLGIAPEALDVHLLGEFQTPSLA